MKVLFVKAHQGLPYEGMLPGEVGDHGRTLVIADRGPRSAGFYVLVNAATTYNIIVFLYVSMLQRGPVW